LINRAMERAMEDAMEDHWKFTIPRTRYRAGRAVTWADIQLCVAALSAPGTGTVFRGLHRAEGGFECVSGPGFQHCGERGEKWCAKAVRFDGRGDAEADWPSRNWNFDAATPELVVMDRGTQWTLWFKGQGCQRWTKAEARALADTIAAALGWDEGAAGTKRERAECRAAVEVYRQREREGGYTERELLEGLADTRAKVEEPRGWLLPRDSQPDAKESRGPQHSHYVLEVVEFITEKNGPQGWLALDSKHRHVGYMRAKFRTRADACAYYDRHNPAMRALNAHGTYESDWHPDTRLFYIVRADNLLVATVPPFEDR